MRRGLYRAAWLVILCALLLALSVPSMRAASSTNEARVVLPAVATGDVVCTNNVSVDDGRLRWRALLDQMEHNTDCGPAPATVLIARDRPSQGAAAGAPSGNSEPDAQLAGRVSRR